MGIVQSRRRKGTRSRSLTTPRSSSVTDSDITQRHWRGIQSSNAVSGQSPTPTSITSGVSLPSWHSLKTPSKHKDKKKTIPFSNPAEYNGLRSDSFFIPKDWDTQDRWYALHIGLKQLFGDNAEKVTIDRMVPGARIVELACGNGPWLMELATQFPECEFTGIETAAELTAEQLLLNNVQFKVMRDLNDPLPFNDNSVDAIRISGTLVRFRNTKWDAFYKELFRVLKPNGVFEMIEVYFAPNATVMLNSFFETIMTIFQNDNQDYDVVFKAGARLAAANFEQIALTKRTLHLGSSGKLGEQFIAILLRAFEAIQPYLESRLRMDHSDYQQRVEMLCAQCAQYDVAMDWYRIAVRKPPAPS